MCYNHFIMGLKFKLISCDMDDTLLRHDGTFSKRNLDVIHEFERRGGVFMVNTGRMHASVIKRVREINLLKNSPVSSFQGAMVRESETGKMLYFKPLGYETSLQIVLDCERMGVHAQIYDLDNLYFVKNPNRYGEQYSDRCDVDYINVPSLSEYMIKTKMNNVKVIYMDEPEKVQGYMKTFREKYGHIAMFNTSALFMGEAVSKEAGKDVACDFICARMGISIAECMAIGDSMNDYNMLKHAGLGVAVANAQPKVLEIADYITDTSENDGVAKVIEKFCF